MKPASHGDLIVGAFYWVRIAFDPDFEPGNEWVNDTQPARYAGGGRWNYLGIDGESDWPVIWVGEQICAAGGITDGGQQG